MVGARHVPAGERVLIATRPSAWFILLSSLRVLTVLGVMGAAVLWLAMGLSQPWISPRLLWVLAGVGAAKVVWEVLDWACRAYLLTDRRVLRVFGVLRRRTADMPLEKIQEMTLYRSVAEQVLGLGSIGFATAGSGGFEAYWLSVTRPQDKMEAVRRAMERAMATVSVDSIVGRTGGGAKGRPVVIGMAGGIGAGKSRVAAEFARLGAVVIDSDKEAKDALDRPEVRETLRGWWGDRIVGPEGRTDRGAVAKIIFSDPAERRRLEELVHPLVRRTRAAVIAEARRAGAAAVVVDAPLLFEAGVAAECDVVVFVDAPREVRVERVRATRGWDEAELERRELQQWPLEEKRRRSQFVVVNAGDEGTVAAEAARVYRQIVGAGAEGGPGGAAGPG